MNQPEQRVPWYLWCAALAVTSAYVGGYWDISWHRSIGRDTFWSAPHIAIYACGVLAALSSGYLIFTSTFGNSPALRASGVRIWGLSGPIGAFISAWGGGAMLVSAPFDDWWHNAYGLDVKIVRGSAAVHRPSLDDDRRRLASTDHGNRRPGRRLARGSRPDIAAIDAGDERRPAYAPRGPHADSCRWVRRDRRCRGARGEPGAWRVT